MNKFLATAALILGFAAHASAQYCPSCIQNSAIVQNAQMNITSATIRGPLYVGSLVAAALNIGSITATTFTGDGSNLTILNASQLSSGTVPSARVSGAYSGITGVGVLASGTWNGGVIASPYGGTGANLGTSAIGSIPYFSSVGTMSALSPGTAGYLLQANGSAAPAWTGAPQILGTNVTSIPMANLTPGNLPMNIAINDASISTVSASKVIGNIPGNATNITGTLPLTQLAAGTLVNTIVASSITVTGVTPGIWGGPNLLIQATLGTDGRVTSISQSSFTVNVGSITAGPLPGGVTIAPSQIIAGSLGASVIASSLNVTGVTAGAYGLPSQVSSFTVTSDGRLTLAGQVPIAINTTQINNGALPAGVTVPPSNVTAGTLASNVIASSVATTGITPGTYGGPGNSLGITIGTDGRVSAAVSYGIPGVSTSAAGTNVDNNWSHAQTSQSSWTIKAPLSATFLVGDGSGVTNLTPSQISGGALNAAVVASSVTVPWLVVPGSITAANFYGNGGTLTGVVNTNVYNVFGTSQAFPSIGLTYGINAATGVFSGAVSAGSFSGPLTGNVTGNVTGSAGTVPAAGVNAGSLGASVIASSVAVAAVGQAQIAPLAITAANVANATLTNTQLASGSYGAITTLPSLSLVSSAVTHTSSVTVTGESGIAVVSSVTARAFVGDGSNLTNVASNKFGFLSASNATLGVGTFSFGYTNAAVHISSISVIITTSGTGGVSGTIWSCCYGGSCVSATSTQGAAIGSTYTSNGSVAVAAGGQIVLEMQSTGEVTTPTANVICGYQ